MTALKMELTLWRRVGAAAFIIFLSSFEIMSPGHGQTAGSRAERVGQHKAILAFDVVSIRRSGNEGGGGIRILPDGYQAKGLSIDNTILLAYVSAPYFKHRDELKGGPEWIHNELYDLDAKISPDDLDEWKSQNQNMMQTPKVLQAMLRTMLAERFKLTLHRVPAEVDGYALTLSRRKLSVVKESSDEASTVPGMPLLEGGRATQSVVDSKPLWTFSGTSMTALVGFLSFSASGPIVDKTGLAGKFHFSLSTFELGPATVEGSNGMAPDPDRIVPFDLGAVGLELHRMKVPVEAWSIDAIQRPTAN